VSTARHSNAAMFLLGVASLALGGCVASIKQERVEGPARLAPDGQSIVVEQRRTTPAPDSAAPDPGAEPAPAEVAECREVRVTTAMVRDVDVRRSFADNGQEKNIAMTALVIGGIAFTAYGANAMQCPQCFDVGPVKAAEYAMLGLAAIPIAFLAYNALRVQDRHVIESVAPEELPGPWHACDDAAAR
jgi:hypothetical protein